MSGKSARPGLAAVDDAVAAQRSMIERWSRYAVGSIERARVGDYDPRKWVTAWQDWAVGSFSDGRDLLRALSEVRGKDGKR